MKKFLGKLKRNLPPEAADRVADSGSMSVHSESDSLKDFQPMFDREAAGGFTNDPNLNLNPSISDGASALTNESAGVGKSVFSSKYSRSTKQSSYFSHSSTKSKQAIARAGSYGQRLQILEVPEEAKEELATGTAESVAEKLHALWLDISYILGQYNNSVISLSTTVVDVINCLKEFTTFVDKLETAEKWWFTSYNNEDVRRILKTYLHFYDNLLQDDAYIKLKLLLCKTFNEFTLTLKSFSRPARQLATATMCKPQNFAIGANDGKAFPNEDVIARIMHKLANSSLNIKEQNGSFLAPIARGVGRDMNVLCLYFGYPTVNEHHYTIVSSVQEMYDDIHVIVAKNQIELASATTDKSSNPLQTLPDSGYTNIQRFKLPFRNPSKLDSPPMSLSVSTESSARVSGTMGGYIYPIIDTKAQPNLSSYANSKFSISCGHVCLDKREDGTEYHHISSPLSVLISLYKQALTAQYQKLSQGDEEVGALDSRAAYGAVLQQLDDIFPVKEIKVWDPKSKQSRVEKRNFPKHRFGQIIWGERTLIQAKNVKKGQMLNEKRLSDLAIIKVNKLLKCDQNYLGDDVAFNEYDPSLMFDNLYVRKVINLNRRAKEYSLNDVHEVDSVVSTSSKDSDGSFNNNGLPVFKYGSTTRFTKGNLNGIKLVYWMDGSIHSSEFVVNSLENTTAFAAGGDSGAWILAKLEDVRGVPEDKGLGVVGMLHSYDGEFRQFGLFTPMTEILDRLEEVTKIKWGVVGVNEKGVDISSPVDSEDEVAGMRSFSDEYSAYESVDEQAYPPDID